MADQDRLDAAEKARLAVIVEGERRARETREAIARERQRADAEAARVQAEADARAADEKHQGAINRTVREALTVIARQELDIDLRGHLDAIAVAQAIVTAIANGEVQYVTINYRGK